MMLLIMLIGAKIVPDKYEWLSMWLHSHLFFLMAVCITKAPQAKCQVPTETEMKCHHNIAFSTPQRA